jgi:hypothetical protein
MREQAPPNIRLALCSILIYNGTGALAGDAGMRNLIPSCATRVTVRTGFAPVS